jgi:hypothetical protein
VLGVLLAFDEVDAGGRAPTSVFINNLDMFSAPGVYENVLLRQAWQVIDIFSAPGVSENVL